MYICPVCRKELLNSEKSFRCENCHSFDISASGYVNLLSGGGKNHGDDKEMIAARRRFLQSGHYKPLCEAVIREIGKAEPRYLLDIGCGEGYYTKNIKNAFPECEVYGFDISKKAAEKAAKAGGLHICVASAYHMPYGDGRFDCAVNIFSPLAREECFRVLKRGGTFVLAAPAPDHLIELKSAVYDDVIIKEMKADLLDGFTLANKSEIRYTMDLSENEPYDLFTMTPYYHKTSTEGREKIQKAGKMTVTASFVVFNYRK